MRDALAAVGDGKAHTRGNRNRLGTVDIAQLARREEQTSAQFGGFCYFPARQQDRESIATDATRETLRTGEPPDDVADTLNDLVAGMETERFVDRLELVDVDIEQRVCRRIAIELSL